MQIPLFKDPLAKLHVQIFTIRQWGTACSSFILSFPCLANLFISWLLVEAFPSPYSCAGVSKWCAASDFECIPAYFKTSNFWAREYVLFTVLRVPLPFDLELLALGPSLPDHLVRTVLLQCNHRKNCGKQQQPDEDYISAENKAFLSLTFLSLTGSSQSVSSLVAGVALSETLERPAFLVAGTDFTLWSIWRDPSGAVRQSWGMQELFLHQNRVTQESPGPTTTHYTKKHVVQCAAQRMRHDMNETRGHRKVRNNQHLCQTNK